ncbi:uncharacterized protein EDB93DRAFT_1153190, partial [Suillus bovinus]|uniref:uncharacterized protein n=1 Tax=Suillus bovinus TaxID=48563 RepID=UPI001B86850A
MHFKSSVVVAALTVCMSVISQIDGTSGCNVQYWPCTVDTDCCSSHCNLRRIAHRWVGSLSVTMSISRHSSLTCSIINVIVVPGVWTNSLLH